MNSGEVGDRRLGRLEGGEVTGMEGQGCGALSEQTHRLQLFLGSFGQLGQVQAVDEGGRRARGGGERPAVRGGQAPASDLPDMQGPQGDDTSGASLPHPASRACPRAGTYTSETCTFAEI